MRISDWSSDVCSSDLVEREIFDEEIRIVLQALLIERVKHRVAGAVGGGAGALRGRARPHVLHHAAERALVDLAFPIGRESCRARVSQCVLISAVVGSFNSTIT